MRTAEEAIAAFASWDGTAEYPPGSNRNWITEWYGMGPVAWCAMACSRALIEGGFGTADRIDVPGVNTTSAKGWAYCPYVEADFRAAGRWHDTDPLPGDLVLYDWDGDEWSDHIGLLASVEDDMTLYVWEGNTDEGVVRLKHRSRTYVRGFARPPYLAVGDPPNPVPQEEDDMRYQLVGVSNNRGIFLVGATPLGTKVSKGRIPAVHLAPAEVEAMLASNIAVRNDGADLPEDVFDRRFIVVG
jgi:hypothetical protein